MNSSAETRAPFTRRGRSGAGQVRLRDRKRANRAEGSAAFLQLEKLGRRDPELVESLIGKLTGDVNKLSGSGYGSGRRITALTTEKMAVLAPMPSASVR